MPNRNTIIDLIIKTLKAIHDLLPQLFPEPAYDQDPKELPMNQDPEPVTMVAGVNTKGHPHGWCQGTLEHRKEMYALAKKICQEENLFPSMTRDLLLTVYGESGFNQWCINTDSKDYGIAQFSIKYYCKEYNITPQECLEKPEFCLRVMARNFKAKRQSNWVAYAHRLNHLKNIKTLDPTFT